MVVVAVGVVVMVAGTSSTGFTPLIHKYFSVISLLQLSSVLSLFHATFTILTPSITTTWTKTQLNAISPHPPNPHRRSLPFFPPPPLSEVGGKATLPFVGPQRSSSR